MSNVAVIPARKNSKGLPNKNLSLLGNQNLVERTYSQALKSGLFEKIIITTDYTFPELGLSFENSLEYHLRSSQACTDYSTAFDVIWDLSGCKRCNSFLSGSSICYLQPTSPLRDVEDILESYEMRRAENNFLVVSTVRKPILINKLLRLHPDTSALLEEIPGGSSVNRQEITEVAYMPNGAIYWFEFDNAIDAREFPISGAVPYPMPTYRSIDIDSNEDLLEAKQLIGDCRE